MRHSLSLLCAVAAACAQTGVPRPAPLRGSSEAPLGPQDAAGEQALLSLERALFDALRTRDSEALSLLLADDFQLRSPGQPPTGRAAFLAAAAAIPGQILEVTGVGLHAEVIDGVGAITGEQRARVRLPDGREILDRAAFTDVCARRNGRWQIVLAHSAGLAADSK